MRPVRPHYGHRSDNLSVGPEFGFAGATFAAFAAWAGLTAAVSPDLVMPLLATLFLAFAAGFGIVAWYSEERNADRVTYTDVAGALTLIGLFAAATIDPDQLIRIVATPSTEP